MQKGEPRKRIGWRTELLKIARNQPQMGQAQCLLWVITGSNAHSSQCLLLPQKQTLIIGACTSALCHEAT